MTSEEFPAFLRSLTPEQRKQLAASMRPPIRCGGCDYDPDGARVYVIGGKRLRPAAYRAYQLSLGYIPS